jgi:hypothetical protein
VVVVVELMLELLLHLNVDVVLVSNSAQPVPSATVVGVVVRMEEIGLGAARGSVAPTSNSNSLL